MNQKDTFFPRKVLPLSVSSHSSFMNDTCSLPHPQSTSMLITPRCLENGDEYVNRSRCP